MTTPFANPVQPPNGLRFSVVIPTCRRNDALASCLDHLVGGKQILPADAFEIIVSDDGPEGGKRSRNDRDSISDRALGRWPTPGTPPPTAIAAAAKARGEWLAFTDDDCQPQAGWLAAYSARIDQAEGVAVRVLEGPTSAGNVKNYGPFLTAPLNDVGGLLWSCNFAIERRLFEETGGFDERFPHPHLEDVDLRLRLEDRGVAFPFVPDALVVHPPRPTHPILKWVRVQESAFYLASKRGVPVTEFGQGFMTYLRMWLFTMRLCRNAWEMIRATYEWVIGIALVSCRWPFWQRKYRKMQPAVER